MRVPRGPDHRDVYDATFDLFFPAALGAKTVLLDEDEADDDRVCRPRTSRRCAPHGRLLTDNADLADMDERRRR